MINIPSIMEQLGFHPCGRIFNTIGGEDSL